MNRFAGLLVILLSVEGCSDSSSSDVDKRNIVSPDGKLTLRLVEDRRGGAAVSGWMRIYLLQTNAPESEAKEVFAGSAMGMGERGNFSATWRGAREIEIRHVGGYIVECHPIVDIVRDIRVQVDGCDA
jgi:hypothetical protein